MNNNSTIHKTFAIDDAIANIPRHKRKTTINISRKGSIVKEKCRQLTAVAIELCPDCYIAHEDLTYLVERYCGADKTTVRSYPGYWGRIRRSKRTGEGYIVGETRKGYLEKFGFMHPLNKSTWLIQHQKKLAVDLFPTDEGLGFMKKFSFSDLGDGETGERGNNTTTTTEREREILALRRRLRGFYVLNQPRSQIGLG